MNVDFTIIINQQLPQQQESAQAFRDEVLPIHVTDRVRVVLNVLLVAQDLQVVRRQPMRIVVFLGLDSQNCAHSHFLELLEVLLRPRIRPEEDIVCDARNMKLVELAGFINLNVP